jgi:Ca2+-binding RTX toxin-like protein
MARRPDRPVLAPEELEARDVPAIILGAAINATRTDIAPIGGVVNISEVSFTTSQILVRRNNASTPGMIKLPTANDIVTFTESGSTLTISSTDGIFGRITNSTTTALVSYGTTLSIPNVTSFNATMQLGGNNIVTDSTNFPSFLQGGPGNDIITATGGSFNPALLLLPGQNPNALTPAVVSLLGTIAPKALYAGSGNSVLTVSVVASNCTLVGGGGNDIINGPTFGFFNTLRGGTGNDIIRGPLFGGFNTLQGGTGSDVIIGGFGPDVLEAGIGQNVLTGFSRDDTFLTRNVEPDLIFNQPGSTVLSDPFDFIASKPRNNPAQKVV